MNHRRDTATVAASNATVAPRGTPRLLVAFSGCYFVLFPIPIVTLFWKDQIGLSLTAIMELQAIFGLASVACEFPSGYLADRVGHRAALLVGACTWVVGWTVFALAHTFAALALAETVLGMGAAFVSGADAALLFSSLAALGETSAYRRWDGRMRAAGQASEAASAAAGGWLYGLAPRLPMWLEVPVGIVLLAIVLRMRDVRRPAAAATDHLARMGRVLRHALGHARLRTAMLVSVALGLATFMMVWLIQPWMQRRGIRAVWFGPLWAVANLWLAAMSLASGRVAETIGVRATLALSAVLAVAGYAGLAAIDAGWAVVFYLCFMTTRGLQTPILTTVIQSDAPAEDRASVLSLNALCFRLAFVVAGPSVGMLVDRLGLEPALGVLAVVVATANAAAYTAFVRAHAVP